MATQKPSKPDVILPNNFGGTKTPYTDSQISNGYQEAVPQVVDGGNINYEKDAVFQKLKYLESVADAVNNIPPGKFLVVNSSNQFEYADSTTKSSFGNIGDIEYTSRTDVPSCGAWCDGALYTKAQFPDVYQMLVDGKLQSTTVSAFDSTVSANGSCGFFGLDTSNERFKVPLLKDVYIKAGQAPSIFGVESLSNITGSTYIREAHGSLQGLQDTQGCMYADDAGVVENANGGRDTAGNIPRHLIINASRSSSTYRNNAKANPDHVVYRAYVVLYASAVEASVAQAAEFLTAVSNLNTAKANTDLSNVSSNIDYIVESQINEDGSWYRKYKSGWLEQGGIGLTVSADGTKPVTLIKPFKDTKYIVNWLDQNGSTIAGSGTRGIGNKTTTSFVARNGQDKGMDIGWIAIGQGA